MGGLVRVRYLDGESESQRCRESVLLDPHELFRAIVVLNALFASLAWCLARPNMASILSVVTFSLLWPFVDKPLGGRTVHVVSETSGITTGDFLTVFALGIVALQVARQFRRTQRERAAAAAPSSESPPDDAGPG